MPYLHVNKLIPEHHDKRVKLSTQDKLDINQKHQSGISKRALAREYQVSRRLIDFTIHPEKRVANRNLRPPGKYYDKDKHREAMRKHRHHKQALHLAGELIPNDN